MKQLKFTNSEQMQLSRADFHKYDDEVVQSIHEWEIGADAWNSRLHFIYQDAYSPSTVRDGEAMLARAQEQYVEHFAVALSAIAKHSPIPEVAIRSIEELLKADDIKRTERLRDCRPQKDVPSMNEADIHGIAKAFGDPLGIISTDELLEAVGDAAVAQNMAIEAYRFHLDALSEHVVGHLLDHDSIDAARAKPAKRHRLGSTALNILNHFRRK